MLSTEQLEQVKQIIDDSLEQARKEKLSGAQKFEVLSLLGGLLGALVAVLGIGFYMAIKDAASSETEKVVREELQGYKIPSGIVSAFKLKDGCPAGWTEYAPARGRVIVGVTPENFDIPDGVETMNFQDLGGKIAHRLREPELPVHKHKYSTFRVDQRLSQGGTTTLRKSVDFTEIAGKNDAHRIVQPYVALYFCERDT